MLRAVQAVMRSARSPPPRRWSDGAHHNLGRQIASLRLGAPVDVVVLIVHGQRCSLPVVVGSCAGCLPQRPRHTTPDPQLRVGSAPRAEDPGAEPYSAGASAAGLTFLRVALNVTSTYPLSGS